MRECPSCSGEGSVVFEEDEPAEECTLCEGVGRVDAGCYCAAREPFECCCGYDTPEMIEEYIRYEQN